MTTESKTRGQMVAADISALLRARNPLLWVVTREEARVERLLVEASAAANYVPRMWDAAQGVTDIAGNVVKGIDALDVGACLTVIDGKSRQVLPDDQQDRGVWIMRDLPEWLDGTIGMITKRSLRNLARSLPGMPREQSLRRSSSSAPRLRCPLSSPVMPR